MLAKVRTVALTGLDAHLIDVEVDIAGGLPQFSVVGLPDATVRESRDRVRSALKNTGFHFPAKRITVNLAPADIKKEGAGLDLAIASAFWSRKKSLLLSGLTVACSSVNCLSTDRSNRCLEHFQSVWPVATTASCYRHRMDPKPR
jgi:predicted ATPase with chaperone activity